MSSHFPQNYIDDLIDRVDLVALIKNYLPLVPAGNEFKARCPFHEEKTPSFYIVPLKHFYHCFGCNAHGTAITFLMQFAHIQFIDAVEQLAHSVGMPLPTQENQLSPGSKSDNRPIFDILAAAADWYRKQLRIPHNKAADYLKKRMLDDHIATEYGIGYAPPGWNNLLRTLGTDASKQQLLLESGLSIVHKECDKTSAYDRFRNRIIFPVHDSRGRITGFGGRTLDEDGAKYLNSPQSSVFHKKQTLYGLHQARLYSHKANRILVTEGYMDVLALAQFGLRESVATLGTSITKEHIQQLFRTCSNIVFCFDGDTAGRAAAWRALKNTLPLLYGDNQAKFLFLPNGHDPDSFIRSEGEAAFEKRAINAVSTSDYLFHTLYQEVDLDSPEGRARMTATAQPLLRQIPPGPYYQQMQQRLQELSGDQHSASVAIQGKHLALNRKPLPRTSENLIDTLETRVICILLHHPQIALSPQFKSYLALKSRGSTPETPLLKALIDTLLKTSTITLNTGQLVERFRGDPLESMIETYIAKQPIGNTEKELLADINHYLEKIANRDAKHYRTERLKVLSSKPREALNETEQAELQRTYRTETVIS